MAITIKAKIRLKNDTTANWNQDLSFVPDKGEPIVYTDYKQVENDQGEITNVPGIKIGDGNAYLVDLPFIDDASAQAIFDEFSNHVSNTSIHVSSSEKEVWNNKTSCSLDGEVLTLSTD